MENKYVESCVFTLDNSHNLSSSVLEAKYYPPIDISDGAYEIALLNLKTCFKISNISSKLKNNTFKYIKDGNHITVEIPEGTYGINHIKDILEEKVGDGFVLNPNEYTFKCEIKSVYQIDFSTSNSIGTLLGFNKRKLEPNIKHISDNEVDIFHVKSIRVHCPIAIGRRVNSNNTNIIYDFYIDVDPGYDIIEKPINIQYYPVIDVDKILGISLEFRDQQGLLIDFRNEYIEATVQIRKV